jgi:hypothetical protein
MTAAAGDAFTPESIDLAWREDDAGRTVAATCRFELAPIRHVIRKHVASGEPWTKILGQRLVERLSGSVGGLPGADCREFVKSLSMQMHNACREPRLCRFEDVEITDFDDSRHAGEQIRGRRAMQKILFVLPSGGVVFVRLEPTIFDGSTVAVFLTAFLPRHVGWVVPARAAATTAGRYVQRWATHHHPTGGLLLPEPDEAVTERDEVENRAIHRRWFRFISPKAWGFRLQRDGRWTWIDPNPGR